MLPVSCLWYSDMLLRLALLLLAVVTFCLTPESVNFVLAVSWYYFAGSICSRSYPWVWITIHWIYYLRTSPWEYPWPIWTTFGAASAGRFQSWQGWWFGLAWLSWLVRHYIVDDGSHGPLLIIAIACISLAVYFVLWWESKVEKVNGQISILILGFGSRGDLQPLLVLATRLQSRGYRVRVLCSIDQINFCTQWGIEGLPAGPDLAVLFKRVGGLGSTGWELIPIMLSALAWDLAHPIAAACRAFKPDVILYDPSAILHAPRCEKLTGVPAIPVFYVTSHMHEQRSPLRPAFLATSPWVEPVGYPLCRYPGFCQSGAWLRKGESQTGEPPALEYGLNAFLKAGKPPVAIGWGSMLARGLSPEAMLIRALQALQTAGKRGVILGGWAELDQLAHNFVRYGLRDQSLCSTGLSRNEQEALAEFADRNCFFVRSAPHHLLLPRCSCFVHHGGSGTTHAALSAACPAVITPIAFDQFYWATQVKRLGAGVGFDKPLPSITSTELAHAIQHADERCQEAAKRISCRLTTEDGAEKAATTLDDFLMKEVVPGHWSKRFVEVHGLARYFYI